MTTKEKADVEPHPLEALGAKHNKKTDTWHDPDTGAEVGEGWSGPTEISEEDRIKASHAQAKAENKQAEGEAERLARADEERAALEAPAEETTS